MLERVIKFIEDGGNKSRASALFQVSRDTIYQWLRLKTLRGTLKNDPPPRKWKKVDPEVLLERVKDYPDLKQADHATYFGVSETAIYKVFRRLGITRKKRPPSTKNGVKKNVHYFWST